MEDDKKVVDLNLDDILPNRFQPRIKFDERAMDELAGSIKEYGVIQPILVRPIGEKYEIIAGERRYKASVLVGKETIPAIISDFDDRESAEIALIENIQRRDLTPIEEAVSYKKILDMGYLNQEELAEKIDRNQSTISNKLRLLNLQDEVQDALLENKISERHARSLLRLEEKEKQIEMLERVINERLTVRKTDEKINDLLNIKPNITESFDIENEETAMNENKEMTIFNMPSAPIIDDIEIFDDINLDDEFIDIVSPTSTPGFLDIENIEKTAEDINVEKPLADLDSLLKVDSNQIIEQPVEEKEQFQHGKFFSVPVKEAAPKEAEIESPRTDNFDLDSFDFDVYTDSGLNYDSGVNVEEDVLPSYNFEITSEDEILPNYDFDTNVDEITLQSNNVDELVSTDSVTIPSYDFEEGPIEKIADESATNVVDFSTILSTVRECARKIEALGYFIDVDELDFENTYQVIFNIEKK